MQGTDHKLQRPVTLSGMLLFLIPSLIGILLFIVPLPYQDSVTIPVAWFAKLVESTLAETLPLIASIVMGVTVIGTLWAKLTKSTGLHRSPFAIRLFDVGWLLVIGRLLGFGFAVVTMLQWGPVYMWSENTGGMLLSGLIPLLFTVFLFAGLCLPLLLDFGLLELCGALFTKVMRPVFKLPGRSSIDCLASWVGDGTIGVLLTNKQYEDGYYTEREASVIGTTFSVVSITFSIVVLAELGLEHMLLPYYGTIVLTGLVLAIVMPRIPPLSRKREVYYKDIPDREETVIPSGTTSFRWGLQKAVAKAQQGKDVTAFIKGGVQNVLDMWMGVLPIVMAIGTIALMIAEYTPLFSWLGTPFVPVLSFLQVPEAAAASQTILVGFADMFLPAILGSGIESELTRFIIGCLSVTQLIYMSEVGGLLLGSKLPISMKDLVIIFLLRTLISLPIIVLMAHLIF